MAKSTNATKSRKTRQPRAAKANTATAPRKRGRPRKAEETVAKSVTVRGGGFAVITSNERTIVIPASLASKRTNELSAVGAPVGPLEAYIADQRASNGKLAQGVTTQNSPHSAAAVRANKRTAKAAKARGDAAAVAGKPAKAKRGNGGRRGYDPEQKLTVLVKPKDSGLAAGSGRMAKLERAVKCKTVGEFLGSVVTDANGKEHKCDAGALSGMVKRGHVRLG